MLPFPWYASGNHSNLQAQQMRKIQQKVAKPCPYQSPQKVDPCVVKSFVTNRKKEVPVLAAHLQCQSLAEIYQKSREVGCISFCLPPHNAVSGKVLRHCINRVRSLFEEHRPLIWKIRYTHNPVFRWCNNLYGYTKCADKWSHMEVLYLSHEPYGPSMLESSLIEKFKGHIPANSKFRLSWFLS